MQYRYLNQLRVIKFSLRWLGSCFQRINSTACDRTRKRSALAETPPCYQSSIYRHHKLRPLLFCQYLLLNVYMRISLGLFALTIIGYATCQPLPLLPPPLIPCTSNDSSLAQCGVNSLCCLCPIGGCCAPNEFGCPLGLYTGIETWPEGYVPVPPQKPDGQAGAKGDGNLPREPRETKGDRKPLDGVEQAGGKIPPWPLNGEKPVLPDGVELPPLNGSAPFPQGQNPHPERHLPRPEDALNITLPPYPDVTDGEGFLKHPPPRYGKNHHRDGPLPPLPKDSTTTTDEESTESLISSQTDELAAQSSLMRGGNNEENINQSEGAASNYYQGPPQEERFIFFLLKLAAIAGVVYAGYRYYLYRKGQSAQQVQNPEPQCYECATLHHHGKKGSQVVSQNPPQYIAVPISQLQQVQTPQAQAPIQQAHPDQYHVLIPSTALFNDQQQYPPLLQKQN